MIVDLRLAVPASAAWIAAALAIALPESSALVPWAVGAWGAAGVLMTAALLASRLGRPPVAPRRAGVVGLAILAATAAAAAALSLSVVAIRMPDRDPLLLLEAAESGRTVEALVQITGAGDDGRSPVVIRSVEAGGARVDVSSPALAFAGALDDARLGESWRVTATVSPTEPGDSTRWLVFPRGSPELVSRAAPLVAAADGLRAGFRAASADLPGTGGDLVPGLAIGDTAQVSDDLDADMKASSLSHLTAVSGANCAIVVALALFVAGALGMPRGARVGLAVALLAGFVILVTPEPSVLRAAVMAVLVLLALALGRPVRGVPLLSAAVLVLLVVDPWLAREYGFVLSVLATGGLLLLAGPLTRALARVLPTALAAVIAVPLAAQLACQPVLILLDAALPLHGVAANILAAPAAPVATMVGLAGCLLLPVLPPLGAAALWLAWLPASWIAAVAGFTAELPGARLPWLPGAVGVVALALLSALALAAVLARPERAVRRWLALAVAGALMAYGGALAGSRIAAVSGRPADWQLALCDVGQGDALVVRSAGRVALIDTGAEPAPLASCLDDLGVAGIDLLILTHFDLDHIGGTEAVLGRVERVLVGPSDGAEADRLVRDLESSGAVVSSVSRGAEGTLGGHRWELLWPPARGQEPGNDASLVLRLSPGAGCTPRCLDVVALGDLGELAQARLQGAVRPGRTDVVKVAHHGSADQSPRLYEALRPALGLIGVGAENDYGHPTRELLATLEGIGTTAARSDTDGLILVAPAIEPGGVRVWRQRTGDGRAG